jgi:hypothetical protein
MSAIRLRGALSVEAPTRLRCAASQVIADDDRSLAAVAAAEPMWLALSNIVTGEDDQTAEAPSCDIDEHGHERLLAKEACVLAAARVCARAVALYL